MYLLDTVVLSELRKTGPNRSVISFLTPMAPDTLFLSSMPIGEIEAGIQRQRGRIRSLFDHYVRKRQQRRRELQSQPVSSCAIDRELVSGWQCHRQLGRARAP